MNEARAIKSSDETGAEPQGQLRKWVAPSFERIALKDALGAPSIFKWTLLDFVTHSS